MVTQAAPERVLAPDCIHFWMIESPNGPQSIGTCRRCGRVDSFDNSHHDDKRVNNSDIFACRRSSSGERAPLNDDRDWDVEVRSMFSRQR